MIVWKDKDSTRRQHSLKTLGDTKFRVLFLGFLQKYQNGNGARWFQICEIFEVPESWDMENHIFKDDSVMFRVFCEVFS